MDQQNTIDRVTVTRTASRKAPFRYTAHMSDGSTATIRTSTRRYENAFQYSGRVNGSAAVGSLGSFFLFGKRPASGEGTPTKTFRVEEAL